MREILIKNVRIVDPSQALDAQGDLLLRGGFVAPDTDAGPDCTVLDGTGLVAAPGLVDMHVHFRGPGQTHKEDIFTGAAAAAAGGVTTAVCMPNTSPVADTEDAMRYVLDKGAQTGIRVLPYGAVTVGQRGQTLTDHRALLAAGAAALSDDGVQLQSATLMRQALLENKETGALICSHCEDTDMVKNYAVNEGEVSRQLGLPGRPAIAEELMVARDAMLALETGGRVHICHVSTAKSLEIIRDYRSRGAQITCETCPQYFTLTERAVLEKGTLARVNPPLRTEADRQAVLRAVLDGTVDAIVTDHAPHSAEEKAKPLPDAPSGMVGLETSLALTLTMLFQPGLCPLSKIVELMSCRPARLLNLPAGTLRPGAPADVVLFDPSEKWTVEPEKLHSKSKNTPFGGMELTGRVKMTICRGQIVYRAEQTGGTLCFLIR